VKLAVSFDMHNLVDMLVLQCDGEIQVKEKYCSFVFYSANVFETLISLYT